MLALLKKSYPCKLDFKENLGTILFVSVFVVLFVWYFKPLKEFIELDLPTTIGYGVITFIISTFVIMVVPVFSKTYHSNETWNVGKEILRLLIVLLSISIVNYFYSIPFLKQGQPSFFSVTNIIKSITTTASIGIIPIAFIVLYNQNRLLKKHIKESTEINDKIHDKEHPAPVNLILSGEGKKESVQLKTNELLYIKSDGNYCELITSSQKYILRSSLANLSDQLKHLPLFIQVHRSYIVNTDLIDKISGNAQGYKIHFSACEDEVPVSRNNSATIKQFYN